MIVLIPDHCLSIYFTVLNNSWCMSPHPRSGDHTDFVIFMNNHSDHQYIIPRRGRDDIHTGSKMKLIFINSRRD